MLTAIGALIVMVDAMDRSVIRSATNLPAGDLPNDDHTDSMDEMWVRAEEDFGLVRPEPRETRIAIHRQTSQRLAYTSDTWEEIPVHVGMPPAVILSDIAYGYNDICANWEDATWWLCRVHGSSRSSRQPVLALTNYVLVQGEDFLMADMRPHGLFELVFGDSLAQHLCLAGSIYRSCRPSLQPLVSRTHFGITVHGSYNGARMGNRLILCESGFFIWLHFQATVSLLGELSQQCSPAGNDPARGFLRSQWLWRAVVDSLHCGWIHIDFEQNLWENGCAQQAYPQRLHLSAGSQIWGIQTLIWWRYTGRSVLSNQWWIMLGITMLLLSLRKNWGNQLWYSNLTCLLIWTLVPFLFRWPSPSAGS